jgi:hypothetical protein
MARDEITQLVAALQKRQADLSNRIMSTVSFDDLGDQTPDGFTMIDVLQMWVHELRSHHRDLIMARGRLVNENPHFHVPHFIRRANEEFGKFIGELSALSDEDLDRRVPPDGRTIREIAKHVGGTMGGFFVQQIDRTLKAKAEQAE